MEEAWLLGMGELWPYALTFDQRSKRVRIAVPKKERVQKGKESRLHPPG